MGTTNRLKGIIELLNYQERREGRKNLNRKNLEKMKVYGRKDSVSKHHKKRIDRFVSAGSKTCKF